MVCVATTKPLSSSDAPNLESLSHIDITKLSQSELYALSLCSDSAFDLRRPDDVVIPNIDRSLFNESAGSRRQTYPRSRLLPRSRLPGFLPSLSSSSISKSPPADDPENKFIVYFLKQLINPNSPSPPPRPFVKPVVYGHADVLQDTNVSRGAHETAIVVHSGEKRKRERKSKAKKLQENGIGIELEMVNRNGVAVDFSALEGADDVYIAELKKRTGGLETEEEVLGFLKGLEGQWCSRRKKRKFVDASEFGDSLPIGWKLLLGLRRREGRVSVYCRRYISPTGKHFISCKEAGAFLQSYFWGSVATWPMDQSRSSIQQEERSTCPTHAGFADNDVDKNLAIIGLPALGAHEKEISLADFDNLSEVQVLDLFECYKCNMSFDERNDYLQHLMSFHQKTTRRYKLGMSDGGGVIIRDGKYECQFCHKIFEERRSYNGHVGIHVRNYVRGSEDLPATPTVQRSTGSASLDKLPSRMSKMDALVEIAQSSIILENCEGHRYEQNGDCCANKLNVERMAATTCNESNVGSEPGKIKIWDRIADRDVNQQLTKNNSKSRMIDGELLKSDDTMDVGNSMNLVCAKISEHKETSDLKICSESSHVKLNSYDNTDIQMQTVQENAAQNGITKSSIHLVQSISSYPEFTPISDKEENDFVMVGQKLDMIMGFEELRFNEIEPLKYDFMNGKESSSLPGISVEVMNDEGMEEGYSSLVRFESEAVISDLIDRHQVTTLCVWCRTEFSHEAIDSDLQSDSIGFMCPACKDKISGHLDNDLSMGSHSF